MPGTATSANCEISSTHSASVIICLNVHSASRGKPEVNDSNCRSVISPCGPDHPSTVPVVESSVRNPWSTSRRIVRPATIFDADAIAIR